MFIKKQYIKDNYSLNYIIDFPDNFSEKQEYPIIFFFHGMGSARRGIDFLQQNCPVRREHIPVDTPFIIVAPSCDDYMWFENTQNVIYFLKECISWPFVDKNSVYLTGASMGGYFSWTLSALHPEMFSAAVICCGAGPYFAAGRIKFPVKVVAGALDTTVLPRESELMAEKINAAGGNAQLIIYEDLGHNVWARIFGDAETYKWLIDNKKSKP